MPNWCSTSYIVTGDENEVRDLYEKMRSLEEAEKPLEKNKFFTPSLGDLVRLLGGDRSKIYCRGEWSDLEKDCDDGALRFNTLSAWNEPHQVMAFLKTKYPNLEFYFQAEEPGMGYFVTNDADGEYFPARYYFAKPDDCEPFEYCGDELDDFLNDVGNFLGKKIRTAEEARSGITAYNQDKKWEECAEIKIYRLVG